MTRYVLASLALLVPCYWQPRIQAGDLSSHVYNAWLANLIDNGGAQGLVVVRQNTNVLFDLILGSLMSVVGPSAAEHIAVSLTVLIFVWGAFALVSTLSGRRSLHHLPVIAMLAYGWVFHIGFFNFYLSLGLCLWALALMWNPTLPRLVGTLPLLTVAYVAHALPVAWAGSVIGYIALTRRSVRLGRLVVLLCPVLLIVIALAIAAMCPASWSSRQVVFATGLDQVLVYDGKYLLLFVGLAELWGVRLLTLVRRFGVASVLAGRPFQIAAMTAAAIVLLPGIVWLPGFHHSLVFIPQRMSLASAVLACGVLGGIPHRPFERNLSIALMLVFFAFLYRDERALNGLEARLAAAVDPLPPAERVVSAIDDPGLRINAVAHMIDRVCVGRCYSYANYEPSTAAFRVRAVAENPVVVSTYADSWALQTGTYVVKERDLPLYVVDLNAKGQTVVRPGRIGLPTGRTEYDVLHGRRRAQASAG
jgi:hypothetical protein